MRLLLIYFSAIAALDFSASLVRKASRSTPVSAETFSTGIDAPRPSADFQVLELGLLGGLQAQEIPAVSPRQQPSSSML